MEERKNFNSTIPEFSQESSESLIHRLVYLMGQTANKVLSDKFDLNFTQFRILMELNYNPDTNQKNIANCVGMTEGGISKAILDLENKGVITSSINPKNRRERHLNLTQEGKTLFKKAAAELKTISQKIFSALNIQEVENFNLSLKKLITQFN